MAKRNDGGPAFPMPAAQTDEILYEPEVGMSLRDWFAGQALAGMISDVVRGAADKNAEPEDAARSAAGLAYVLADAMLAIRELPNAD